MTARVFDHAFAWQMTHRQFTEATSLLAAAAASRFGSVDHVVAIGRGGTEPAGSIAGKLGARLHTVWARHNPTSDLYTQATGRVWCTVSGIAAGSISGCILVVDDICGTGATLDAVTSSLTDLAATGARLHTATLCRNAAASHRPGLTVWDGLREWVVFPWEPRPPAGTTIRILPDPGQVHA